MSAVIVLDNGLVLGFVNGELPKEGEIIQVLGIPNKFYRVTSIVRVMKLEAHHGSPASLYPDKITRIFVEEPDHSEMEYLSKILSRLDSQGV